jgi:hypothetical protein
MNDIETVREARIEAAADAIYSWTWGSEDEPSLKVATLDIEEATGYRQMAAAALAAVGALDADGGTEGAQDQ